MKITVISPFPPSLDSNADFALLYVKNWLDLFPDIEISVLCNKTNKKITQEGYSHIPQTRIDVQRIWDVGFFARKEIKSISERLESFQPDLIYINNNIVTFGNFLKTYRITIKILYYALRHNINTVVTVHSVIVDPMLKLFGLNLKKLGRFGEQIYKITTVPFNRMLERILSLSSLNVFTSRSALNYVSSLVDRKIKKVYIPLGMDLSKNISTSPKVKDRGVFKISYFGFLAPYKGIEDIINAAKYYKNISNRKVKFQIYGSAVINGKKNSKYLKKLETMIQKHDLGMLVKIYEKYYSNEEIHCNLSSSELVVYPFYDDGILSSSASIYEALMTDAKIIVSDSGRLTDFVDFEGVFMYHSRDPNSLIQRINEAMDKPEINNSLRKEQLHKHYDINVARTYFGLFNEIKHLS